MSTSIISSAVTQARGPWRLLISGPVIWGMIIPIAFLDLTATLYQSTCFPLYGLNTVNRSQYVIFGRYKLPYLNFSEKTWCWYCEYANGVINYVRKIASETERMWCPIKHALKREQVAQAHQATFPESGDQEGLERHMQRTQQELSQEKSHHQYQAE